MSAESGYLAPSVTAVAELPQTGAASVLIVPVVAPDSDTAEDAAEFATVATTEPALPADAVAEIEAGLRSLRAKGGTDQVHRLIVGSLPADSVLTVGLGAPRDEWPADAIRRAAGTAARSLNGAESVTTTLAGLPAADAPAATVEGLVLGSYRFTKFRSEKTAPKDAGLATITVVSSIPDAER